MMGTGVLAGCAGQQAQPPVNYTLHTEVSTCPRPGPLTLEPLVRGRHLAHPANAAVLARNTDLTAAHINDLDAALDCYEAQGKEQPR